MIDLAQNGVSEEVFKSLAAAPQQVHAILIATKHELEEQLADRIRLQMCYPLALTLSQQLTDKSQLDEFTNDAILDQMEKLKTHLSHNKS